MRSMRWVFAASFLPLMCHAAQADTTWTSFVDPSNTVSVSLPSPPVIEQEGKVKIYTVDRGTVALMVRDFDFGDTTADPAAMIDSGVKALSQLGTVERQKTVIVDGHEGRDVVLSTAEGAIMEDCAFVIDGHLYQFLADREKGAPDDAQAMVATFVASIHFLR